ncbi:hypothetical protein QWU01_23105 [Kluyvera cryocrescens]|uniref:Uncharacterized protein n=1 Tax=Kluyvera cryocrescens TaxID=580 RepID=A0AAW9CFY0_KLUCR|nr:hypothetical protein [Kluyvera cryocrescens]MDW3779692.1 hypothetical protein [Kluyvera cryocrescens]MEB7558752.1 hypothetical protein [Kluyvera cryocrescens]
MRQQLPGGVWPDDPARWRDGEPKGARLSHLTFSFRGQFQYQKKCNICTFSPSKNPLFHYKISAISALF